jgi:hypothetical protein
VATGVAVAAGTSGVAVATGVALATGALALGLALGAGVVTGAGPQATIERVAAKPRPVVRMRCLVMVLENSFLSLRTTYSWNHSENEDNVRIEVILKMRWYINETILKMKTVSR